MDVIQPFHYSLKLPLGVIHAVQLLRIQQIFQQDCRWLVLVTDKVIQVRTIQRGIKLVDLSMVVGDQAFFTYARLLQISVRFQFASKSVQVAPFPGVAWVAVIVVLVGEK